MIFIEHNSLKSDTFLTLFRMGFFAAAHGWGGGAFWPPLLKISHTYPTMMKLGKYTLPKEDPKEDYFNFS